MPEKKQNEMNDYDAVCELANFLMHEGRYITKKAYYDNYRLYFDDIFQLFAWLMENMYVVPVLTFNEERHRKIIVMEGTVSRFPYSTERCPDFRFIYWIYNREFYELVKEKASDMRDCIYHIICKKGHGCDPDAHCAEDDAMKG